MMQQENQNLSLIVIYTQGVVGSITASEWWKALSMKCFKMYEVYTMLQEQLSWKETRSEKASQKKLAWVSKTVNQALCSTENYREDITRRVIHSQWRQEKAPWYWVGSYFVFLFHFLLEGFPYCGESVCGCNGGFHLWSWKRQVPEHKPGHSSSWEETQFRPWAEGHPYSAADNLLKTSCSLLFGHKIGPKLQKLGPALSWVPHIVFLPGKNSRCSLFSQMYANGHNKRTGPSNVNLGFWWLQRRPCQNQHCELESHYR